MKKEGLCLVEFPSDLPVKKQAKVRQLKSLIEKRLSDHDMCFLLYGMAIDFAETFLSKWCIKAI